MPKKGYTLELIIYKLREAEILLSQESTVSFISKKIGVTVKIVKRVCQKLTVSQRWAYQVLGQARAT